MIIYVKNTIIDGASQTSLSRFFSRVGNDCTQATRDSVFFTWATCGAICGVTCVVGTSRASWVQVVRRGYKSLYLYIYIYIIYLYIVYL